jgi:hypothetical protein
MGGVRGGFPLSPTLSHKGRGNKAMETHAMRLYELFYLLIKKPFPFFLFTFSVQINLIYLIFSCLNSVIIPVVS